MWKEGKREVEGEKKEEDEGKRRGENDIGLVSFSSYVISCVRRRRRGRRTRRKRERGGRGGRGREEEGEAYHSQSSIIT